MVSAKISQGNRTTQMLSVVHEAVDVKLLMCVLSTYYLSASATLRVPGADSDDESKTPSPSPRHGRSRPSSTVQESSSESDEGDARGEV